jgi:predicted nucleic acid-binding protein
VIVVDASVAVKWFIEELGSETAETLLTGPEKLIAPALIRVEVAAAITRKVRPGEIESKEAEEACRLWIGALASGVPMLSPDEENLESAIELALQIRHPLQDCIYLALARRVNGTLVTADPKFAKNARGCYANVENLV